MLRAVVLRGGRLQVRDTPDPRPGAGELLLRTSSTAIRASDLRFMDHPEPGADDPTGRPLYDADRGIVLGDGFVGEAVGRGPGYTEQFGVGARVTAMPQGSFAELLVVSEAAAKTVPAGVSSSINVHPNGEAA